jgi:hypothetical protein
MMKRVSKGEKINLAIDAAKQPVEILRRLAADKDRFIRGILAASAIDQDVLAALVEDSSPSVSSIAIRRIDFDRLDVKRIENDPSSENRSELAMRPDVPIDVLRRLIGHRSDRDRIVARRVCHKPDLPEEIDETLAANDDNRVRFELAFKLGLSAALVEKLSKDRSGFVRRGIALRGGAQSKISRKLIRELSADRDATVRQAIITAHSLEDIGIDALRRLAEDPDPETRNQLAKKIRMIPTADGLPELLAIMAEDEHPNVRAIVAKHPAAPIEKLVKLAADAEVKIRSRVVEHPSLPGETIVSMTMDRSSQIREAARRCLSDRSAHEKLAALDAFLEAEPDAERAKKITKRIRF